MSWRVDLSFILADRGSDEAAARAEVRRFLEHLDEQMLDSLVLTAEITECPSLLDTL